MGYSLLLIVFLFTIIIKSITIKYNNKMEEDNKEQPKEEAPQNEENKSKQDDTKSKNSKNESKEKELIPQEVLTKGNVIINTSPSKQMYSFPRAERFPNRKKGFDCFGYNIPSMMDKRGTSIGYGSKVDFTKKKSGRSEQIYNIPREFDLSRSGSPKYTFGLGRENCYLPGTKIKNNPGPGNYSTTKPFGSDACKFSLFSRRNNDNSKSNYPGPGSYGYIALKENGRYPVSSIENPPRIGFGIEQRKFGGPNNKYPGPGAYRSQAFINGSGIIYNSNYRSNLGKSMGIKLGSFGGTTSTRNYPGPGSYNFFSDFEGFSKGK